MVEPQSLRQLKIKSKMLERTYKELHHYMDEHKKQAAKIAGMRERNENEFDIKMQVEIQAENEVMIPDTMRRVQQFTTDLKDYIVVNKDDADVKGSPELAAALELIKTVSSEEFDPNGDDEDEEAI